MKRALTVGLALVAAMLAGCTDPQTKCRNGVDSMKASLVGLIGSEQHQSLNDPIVEAHTLLDIAEAQLATGQFEGCVENLERARAILNRAHRTNQE